MPEYNRDEIKAIIIKKMGGKVKKSILDKNLPDLIDEYIDNQNCIAKTGYSLKGIPSREDIKWWFQDHITYDKIEISPGVYEDMVEIQIDDICLDDPLATEVFKNLYDFVWYPGKEIPGYIKTLIRLNRTYENAKGEEARTRLKYRLNNIAVVGVIRFYHMERSPYLCASQIKRATLFFRNVLSVIDKVESGSYKNEVIGEVSIFEAFKDFTLGDKKTTNE